MSVSGVDALNGFITNRVSGDRLIIKNNELYLVNKKQISFWSCLKAKFGRGNASMKKVAAFVHENRNNFFPQEDKDMSIQNKKDFNDFIKAYNRKRVYIHKFAKKVGLIEAESITFFGKEEWAKVGIDVKDAPPILPDLKQIYTSPCPIWPGKTIGETHMLVLIPKMLGEKETTVSRLRKLGFKGFTGKDVYYGYSRILKEYDGHDKITSSYWVLMTKDVLPGSLGKRYEKIVKPDNYSAPRVVEANVCILTQYLRNKKITDETNLLFNKVYTWCENTNNYSDRPVIGRCNENGFNLYYDAQKSARHMGLAVVQRLPTF